MLASPHERLDGPALLAIAVALLTWSSAYAGIAWALPAFTPGEVAFARLAIGSLCFALLLAVRRQRLPPWREWPALAALGIVGLTVYHLCLNYAETRIASGTASILIALSPAATAAVSARWLGERLGARMIAGLLIALAGVVLVVLASGGRMRIDPWAALVLVSVAASALMFTGLKPYFRRHGAVGVTALTFFAATLGAAPFAWGLPHALATAAWSRIAALLYLGVAPTFCGYIAWNLALKRAPVGQVTSFIYFSPPIAVLIGWLWLGERLTSLTLLGGAVVVLGVVIANARRRVPARA